MIDIWEYERNISSIRSDDPKGLKMKWFRILWRIFFTVETCWNLKKSEKSWKGKPSEKPMGKTHGKTSEDVPFNPGSPGPRSWRSCPRGRCPWSACRANGTWRLVVAAGNSPKMEVLVGKPWENAGKVWEIIGRYAKTMGKYKNIMGKP